VRSLFPLLVVLSLAFPVGADGLEDTVAKLTVSVGREQHHGSGTTVAVKGDKALLLTAEHVVRGSDDVRVAFPNGRVLTGRVVARDAAADLAAVEVSCGQQLPPRTWVALKDPVPGAKVYVVGDAPTMAQWRVRVGACAASPYPDSVSMSLKTTIPVDSGDSGGGVFDDKGYLVGVVSLVIAGDATRHGYGPDRKRVKAFVAGLKWEGDE
jgi:S1-C subfamily serine protease